MKVIVIGAGLSGLGAGMELKKMEVDFQIIESSDAPGGLAKTDVIDNFPFDYTGHYLHIKTETGYKELIEETTPFIKIKRESAVLIGQKIVPYPIQYNLKYLEPDTVNKVIAEVAVIQNLPETPAETLTQFIQGHFGETLLKLFFKPYNEKLWGTPLDELPKDCIGSYFPKIDLSLLMNGSKTDTAYAGYNNYFYYPVSGKIGALPDALAEKLTGNIVYNEKIERIDLVDKKCRTTNGTEYAYDHLISSMPLTGLAAAVGWNEIAGYKYTTIKNLRLVIKGRLLHHYHWIYIPDENVPFYRIGFPQTIKQQNDEEYISISVELEMNYCDGLSDKQLAELTVNYLSASQIISFDEFRLISSTLISPAYTYQFADQASQIDAFFKYLKEHNVTPIGRYGLWRYFSMEEAYLSGKEAAKALDAWITSDEG